MPNILKMLQEAGNVSAFRAATPLPKRTQEVIDQAVGRVGRQRLVIVDDLIKAGLTVPMANWLSIPTLTSHELGEAGAAKQSMVPGGRGERQIMQWTPYTIPIYCTWDDFQFDVREMMAAERVGQPLDTIHVEQATRNVNLSIEDAAINGGPTIGGSAVPGLLNSNLTYNYASNEAWDVSAHDGSDILADVEGMINVAQAQKFFGPYNLYVPTTYGIKLLDDFKTYGTVSILNRLKEIDTGQGPLNIKTVDRLPANKTLLVQMTSDVVDVIVGQQPIPVSWQPEPGWLYNFVVLACVVTRVKTNAEGNTGIVVGYKS